MDLASRIAVELWYELPLISAVLTDAEQIARVIRAMPEYKTRFVENPMDMTQEQIEQEFRRQVRLCSGIGEERMRFIITENFHGRVVPPAPRCTGHPAPEWNFTRKDGGTKRR